MRLTWTSIYDAPIPIPPPPGIVYSTVPTTTEGYDGQQYAIKGPSLEVVASEASGYLLAAAVGLSVPQPSLCHHPRDNSVYFASRMVRTRFGADVLDELGFAVNPDLLGQCFAFDVWTANIDRNVGNVVAEPCGGNDGHRVRLYAIDFEKAAILRGTDRFTVTAMDPRRFQYMGPLREPCVAGGFPYATCDAIARLDPDEIRAIFSSVADMLLPTPLPWRDSAPDFLVRRAERIHELAREVWTCMSN
jgi:hypothetical protein